MLFHFFLFFRSCSWISTRVFHLNSVLHVLYQTKFLLMFLWRVFVVVIVWYLCNQCLSPLTLWVRILFRRGVLDTTLCDKVCQWLAAGWWFSPGTPVSSTKKTDRHDITEILLKVALNTITLTPDPNVFILDLYYR